MTELAWHLVVESDQIKNVKNGKFYLVTKVRSREDKRLITLETGQTIERPTEKEPTAHVIRGDTGKAVDMFINVFTSG